MMMRVFGSRVYKRMLSTSTYEQIPYTRVPVAKSVGIDVEEGKTYAWCPCGYSKNQPFCDGNHKHTNRQYEGLEGYEPFRPLRWTAEESKKVFFCQCKQTKNPPYCDGSHNQIPDAMTQELPTEWIAFETVDVKEESHDTKRFRFRVKDCKNDLAKLRSLKLKDGQTFHFSVRVEMPDGNLATRPYTPTYFDFERGEGEFVIKRYDDGKVTPTLTDKQVGDVLDIRGPLPGEFLFQHAQDQEARLLLIAAGTYIIVRECHITHSYNILETGTGVTPILQLANSASEDERTFCVVCVTQKSEQDMLCREELKELHKNKDVPVVHVLNSDDSVEYDDENEIIHEGMMITQDVVEGLHMDEPVHEVDRAVICGPPLFNRAMIEYLKECGYKDSQVTVM